MKIRRLSIILFLLLVAGCSRNSPAPTTPTRLPVQNTTLPQPPVYTTSVPDAKAAARSYLDAWKTDNYETMYSLLTSVSQDAISKDKFIKHYQGVAIEAALSGVDYQILSALTQPDQAQVSYRVILHSVLVGDVQGDTLMNLTLEKGQWRVQWDDTLVLADLKGGNYLKMDREGYTPSRANIYDRNGHALVAQADATAIGLKPDEIDSGQIDSLLGLLSNITGMRADTIMGMIDRTPKGQGWYVPVAEVPAGTVEKLASTLSNYSGLYLSPYKSRYYFDGGIAPQTVGYVSSLSPDEVDKYRRMGYQQDELIGRLGLENWGEKYLAGKRGGALYVMSPQGQPVTRLAEVPAQPSQAIYTTLDRDFQEGVQNSLAGLRAAAVVLERNTGRVLALASSPGFDPNAFIPVNFNNYSLAQQIENGATFNLATQGQFPLGSVFKVVTMAAALESGRYTPDSTLMCGYDFTELSGVTLHDWTWEYNETKRPTMPSGLLTLTGGLIRSCDPWFWHIGLSLFNEGKTKAVSDMARGFGLGQPTGIQGVDEVAGTITDPEAPLDATNNAIGQGKTQVTPLQVADFMAAVGNGGTLYIPQLIEKIAPPDGDPTFTFKPEERGKLPVKPETLTALQEAMKGVIVSTKPRGTAVEVFSGLNIPVAGKTGTAQTSLDPHAWFAGYTFAERPDKPDIAIAVVAENAGEGSEYAAPIFRRIVELYFTGKPAKLFPWESTYFVTRTPTPEETETPTPEPDVTATP